jgi:glutamate-1-semialdehyde 2,1-aminomutase
LEEGVLFSLPHPIEIEVAEAIIRMVPCAESVRFGKNGSDATAGAVRLARAFTGRDHVAVCGYHGWQDWYIGSTTRNKGVPRAVSELTHPFVYNDAASLEKIFKVFSGKVAAVIMEPMNATEPVAGFLQDVKAMVSRHGAVLVFDEIVTGFRYAKGGAQEYFGVMPDLACFGKGLANGYPLSAVVGRKDIMALMSEVFFSFTFGGDALSLAAAKATLEKIERLPVIETLSGQGSKVIEGTRALIEKKGVSDVFSISGHPSWSFLAVRGARSYDRPQILTLFLQETFARGILTLGTHNMSFAHSGEDVRRLLAVYEEVFDVVNEALEKRDLEKRLRARPLEALFKLR